MGIKGNRYGFGLTFVEILIAVAILVILVSITIGISNYVHVQGDEKLTESAIGIVVTALEQYYDYWREFPFEADANYGEPNLVVDLDASSIVGPGAHNDAYASSEALYYFLNTTPNSRKLISSLNSRLITNTDNDGVRLEITIGANTVFLTRFIDSWRTSLRYTYEQGDNFPLIISAGPDRKFDTRDDITSTGM